MSDSAINSQGILVKRGNGATPETFTAIPEITSFNGPGGSAPVIDVTDLDSTAKEKLMGLHDEGSLTLNINYRPDNAVHAALREDRANRTLRNFKITFTDPGITVWDFGGYVTTFTVAAGVDATVTASVTIEISGSITES